MHLSDRIKALKISPIRRLIPYADEAKAKGKKVFHLNIGQPDIKTPEEYFNAIRNFHPSTVAYQPSQGIPELREAISNYYKAMNVNYEPNEVYVTCGGSEALQFVVMIMCDPGDEILVPEPFYANYNTFAKLALAKLRPIPTKAETGFHLPSETEIEKLITSKTRAFWVSHPCNPTGVSYTHDEINMLVYLAKKHDLYIIADEVYREFIYEAGSFMSFGEADDALDRVIMIDSVSKRFSACGARIGCIAIKNKDFLAEVMKLCQGRLSVSAVEQVGAAALYKTPKSYLQDVNKEYKMRRDVLYHGLKEIDGVVCHEPKGAFYTMVKLPVDDSEKFIIWMLQNFDINGETTMAAPGSGFYAEPGKGLDEVRMAYVLKTEDLKKALNILKHALAAYPGRLEAIKA
ncbi:MAG: pyridoxal phosphate-dependent aminotransferase [Synergistaceae bacterium]|nr:pyridoxal phosphate-dependent aminotransferase [Synergistaceae bacterium]MBR0250417.1 pyridoxal phosphate-dependent aminotransferase [Synergistaceae bacterium]